MNTNLPSNYSDFKRNGLYSSAIASNLILDGYSKSSSSSFLKNASSSHFSGGVSFHNCIIKINFRNANNNVTKIGSISSYQSKNTDTSKLIAYVAREEATKTYAPQEVNTDYPLFFENQILTQEEACNLINNDPVFSIIISPEEKGIDLQQFANRFFHESLIPAMNATPRCYIAAAHYNTEHPHVHVIFSRIPKSLETEQTITIDKLIKLNGSYITHGRMKKEASCIINSMIGPRTEIEEIKLTRDKCLRSDLSSLDKDIIRAIKLHQTQGSKDLIFKPYFLQDKYNKRMITTRLNVLKTLNYATFVSSKTKENADASYWKIKPSFVRSISLSSFCTATGYPIENTKDLIVDDEEREKYKGKITNVWNNKNNETSYFFIEDEKGRTHLYAEDNFELSEEEYCTDKQVEVSTLKNRLLFTLENRSLS